MRLCLSKRGTLHQVLRQALAGSARRLSCHRALAVGGLLDGSRLSQAEQGCDQQSEEAVGWGLIECPT